MIDLVRDFRVVLAKRVVRQFREMRHGVATGEVALCHIPQVLVDCLWGQRKLSIVAVQPAVAVEAGVKAQDFYIAFQKVRSEDGTDVAVHTSDKDLHARVILVPSCQFSMTLANLRTPAQYSCPHTKTRTDLGTYA